MEYIFEGSNMWLPWFLFAPIQGLLPIHTLTHPIPSRSELGFRIPPYLSYLSNLTNHTLAFLPFPPPMPGLRWRNPQLSHITLRPGGGGEFTPHIITSGNPHDPGLGRSKKSPWGDYTSSGHAFIPLLVCRKEDINVQLYSHGQPLSLIWNRFR